MSGHSYVYQTSLRHISYEMTASVRSSLLYFIAFKLNIISIRKHTVDIVNDITGMRQSVIT